MGPDIMAVAQQLAEWLKSVGDVTRHFAFAIAGPAEVRVLPLACWAGHHLEVASVNLFGLPALQTPLAAASVARHPMPFTRPFADEAVLALVLADIDLVRITPLHLLFAMAFRAVFSAERTLPLAKGAIHQRVVPDVDLVPLMSFKRSAAAADRASAMIPFARALA